MVSKDITPVDLTLARPFDQYGSDRFFGDLEQHIDLMMRDMRRYMAELDKLSFGRALGVRTEVSEGDGHIVVNAELPGYDEDTLDVTLAEGLLTIRAERVPTSSAEKGARNEREYAIFEHAVLLPDGIDSDQVEATLKNGILTVNLPIRTKLAPDVRRIPVQRAEGMRALAKRHADDLAKFREKLTELRSEVAKFSGEVADSLKARMEHLERLGDKFAQRLVELEKAGESAVAGLRRHLESAWHEMSQGLARLSERVRRKKEST